MGAGTVGGRGDVDGVGGEALLGDSEDGGVVEDLLCGELAEAAEAEEEAGESAAQDGDDDHHAERRQLEEPLRPPAAPGAPRHLLCKAPLLVPKSSC